MQSSDKVLFVDFVPHEHLFPHAAFVMHHGGAGVTTNAAKAGVPQIIVPHGVDQFFWGAVLQKKGVAAKPVSRTDLSVEKISEQIGFVLQNKAKLDSKAKEIAAQLNQEDGLSKAVQAINTFAAKHL